VYALVNADEYGAREALLKHADLLFDEASLRALARRFEADLDKALQARGATERHDHAVYKAAAAIGFIAGPPTCERGVDGLCDKVQTGDRNLTATGVKSWTDTVGNRMMPDVSAARFVKLWCVTFA